MTYFSLIHSMMSNTIPCLFKVLELWLPSSSTLYRLHFAKQMVAAHTYTPEETCKSACLCRTYFKFVLTEDKTNFRNSLRGFPKPHFISVRYDFLEYFQGIRLFLKDLLTLVICLTSINQTMLANSFHNTTAPLNTTNARWSQHIKQHETTY